MDNSKKTQKGQATLEALFCFLCTVAMVAILTAAVVFQTRSIQEKGKEMEMISKGESMARAVETSFFCGMGMSFDFSDEGIAYSVEDGRFHVAYDSRLIEIGGIFRYDYSEPL